MLFTSPNILPHVIIFRCTTRLTPECFLSAEMLYPMLCLPDQMRCSGSKNTFHLAKFFVPGNSLQLNGETNARVLFATRDPVYQALFSGWNTRRLLRNVQECIFFRRDPPFRALFSSWGTMQRLRKCFLPYQILRSRKPVPAETGDKCQSTFCYARSRISSSVFQLKYETAVAKRAKMLFLRRYPPYHVLFPS